MVVNDCPNLFQLVQIHGTARMGGLLFTQYTAVSDFKHFTYSKIPPSQKRVSLRGVSSVPHQNPGGGIVILSCYILYLYYIYILSVLTGVIRTGGKRPLCFPLADLSGRWLSLCLPSDERLMECCSARPEPSVCVCRRSPKQPPCTE